MERVPFPDTNDDYSGLENACIICGRSMSKEKPAGIIRLIDGGSSAVHPDSELSDADAGGDIGEFNVGSTCAKKHKLTSVVLKRESSARK